MPDWVPGAIAGGVAIIVALITSAFAIIREIRKDRRDSMTPSPPTTMEVWARQDRLEGVVRSSVHLMGEMAEQWPDKEHPPVLSKQHVAVLTASGYLAPDFANHITESER